ncbi:MAG: hypothetical protein LBR32_07080 [Propionibacteriaceae bacterium]|nr:hypothetical protein [Propionibacteriaceae bacterium]
MATPDLTPILDDLAAGVIDTAEAARRIEAAKSAAQHSPASAPQAAAEPEPEAPKPKTGVERLSVRAVGRKVRILGDPSVATASAQGPHAMRRNQSVLEVNGDGEGFSLEGISIFNPPRSWDDVRGLGLGKELLVRVNPKLVVDIEVTGGALTVKDVPTLGKVRLTAGSAAIAGFRQADDVLIQAGGATLSGLVGRGRSRVRCESGQVTIELDPDSNVTIRGDAQLGKVSWDPGHEADVDEVVVGSGAARLDVGVVMGWAHIKTGEELR